MATSSVSSAREYIMCTPLSQIPIKSMQYLRLQSLSKHYMVFRLFIRMKTFYLTDMNHGYLHSIHTAQCFNLSENQTLRTVPAQLQVFFRRCKISIPGRCAAITVAASTFANLTFSNSEFARLMTLLTVYESSRSSILR